MKNYENITLDDFNLEAEFNGGDENFIQVDGGTTVPCMTVAYLTPGLSNAVTGNATEYSCAC